MGIPSVRDRVAQEVLHQAKLRFVRYADDFVILCWSKHRAEEARKLA